MTKTFLGHDPLIEIKNGDKFTLSGYFKQVPNPKKRWWNFYPKVIASNELEEFVVVMCL